MEESIYKKKQNALNIFLNKVLDTEIKGKVAKIILFGSLSKREEKEASDIDLLIITTDSFREISEACANASFYTALETGESVEPIIRCIDEIRYPRSYFLYSILKSGKEVYSMDEKELKRKEIENYINLSNEYLDVGKVNLRNGYWRIAVDIVYNACELMIKALLLLKLPAIPGSHGGIVQKFGELYIKTGELPKEFGRDIALALEKRNNARYEPHAQIKKEDAEELIILGEKLQKILKEKVNSL